MTLHALRLTIGDEVFFEHPAGAGRASSRTAPPRPAEFIALAEKVSGEQLDELFDAWLFTP